jgi:hypothetical protein
MTFITKKGENYYHKEDKLRNAQLNIGKKKKKTPPPEDKIERKEKDKTVKRDIKKE